MARSLKEAFEQALREAKARTRTAAQHENCSQTGDQSAAPESFSVVAGARGATVDAAEQAPPCRDESRDIASPEAGYVTVRYRGRHRPTRKGLSAATKNKNPNTSGQSERPARGANSLAQARFALRVASDPGIPHISAIERMGRKTQIHGRSVQDEREIVLGIDFGTSSIKVAVGDPALGKVFAVPFVQSPGIAQYLLPSQVYERDGAFSLTEGDLCHRNLKMRYLSMPEETDTAISIVALLALLIRRVRGWILTKHASIFKQSRLLWTVNIGIPATHYQDATCQDNMKKLVEAAWTLAGSDTDITRAAIEDVLRDGVPTLDEEESAEVSVLPEIAAQIYGYVVSSSFDRRADNIYLMADVGSGTLDAALFHVKPGKGGKWGFHFYKTAIEEHGVINLHQHRLDWWTKQIETLEHADELLGSMEATRFATTQNTWIPESFDAYFENVDLPATAADPDSEFFNKHVLSQVRGRVFYRAGTERIVPTEQLEDTPFFLCGGGARMAFYRQLADELRSFPGVSWLRAKPHSLEVPKDLHVEGLQDADYDRLSVAYGLSRVNVDEIAQVAPLPQMAPQPKQHATNYISKDQV